jgi:hypothetical protein
LCRIISAEDLKMSFANPTPLRIGMRGTVCETEYRIAGRIVMGMDDEGTTYYWNEFNLVDDEGEEATLVYEEGEQGGEWRLFTMFEAQYPITAEDAATKQVGDWLNLEGTDVRVTLVDESQVYFIEGEAPEGVEKGDIARYFNAEAQDTMIVVSWTGNELECYLGHDLTEATVFSGFGLPAEAPQASLSNFFNAGQSDTSSSTKWVKGVGVFLALVIAWAGYHSWSRGRISVPYRRQSAPVAPSGAVVGGTCKLEGRQYKIHSHALMEVAEVGQKWQRHEYELRDDEGQSTLLVYPSQAGSKDSVLFKAMTLLEPLTPQQAAAKKTGDLVTLDGLAVPVGALFQETVQQADGSADLQHWTKFFGFSSQAGSSPFLVRWRDNNNIAFYRGTSIPADHFRHGLE